MALRTLNDIENHALFILFLSFILIVFWYAIWELLTELTEHIHERHGIKKWKIYMLCLVLVILIIGIFPQILEKL